ncbi:hypothetical protein Tco_1475505 [Tanacetum coccineum]
MAGVDVDTLTMEQYLALSRENQAPGVVKPEIGGNVNFEIKSQFMRELREDTFSGNKDEDAHDHIDRVLSIVGLFNIPGVSKDAAFIKRYCPPSKTAKQLEDIHSFTQEGDESLYQAWEQYNDLLYKCLTHDINSHQKTMADHSQKWHDRTTSRNIGNSSSNDGLAALVNKLDAKFAKDLTSTRIVPSTRKQNKLKMSDMEKLDEQHPLTGIIEEDKSWQTIKKYIKEASIRQAKQDEWLKTFCHNLEKSQNHHDEIIQGLKSRVTTLAKEAVTKTDKNKDCKAIFTDDGAPLYTLFYYSPEEIKYFSANSRFSDDDEFKNITPIPDEEAHTRLNHQPLRPPSGLKGLLHMLNATVIPTKGKRMLAGRLKKSKRFFLNFQISAAMLSESDFGASDYDNPDPAPELQNVSPSADTTVPSQQELDLLFGPLYDEFFNDGAYRVNKSSSPTDNSVPQDTQPSTNIQPTSEPSTPTNTHAEENNR